MARRSGFALDKPVLELPAILDLPDDLLPLITEINGYRYFMVDSGRAAAKSQSIARLLLYLSEQQYVRIVCGREFQNSIEESVYTIFKDLIAEYGLNFEVTKTEITHRVTKSPIRFRGFREQGATNIKGLEGVDILWVDEAQAITKQTLDVIVPTIRKENAKVYWSMNRHVENDPVFAYFVNRDDCLHIHTDYRRNKHCPKATIKEAELCLHNSPKDYEHIWLGTPLAKSEDYLFSLDMIRASLALDLNRLGIQRRVLANDVARYGDCENVFCGIESRGPIFWEQIHQEVFRNMGLDETVGKHLSLKRTMNFDLNVVDDDGMGGGVTDNLPGIEVMPFHAVKDFAHDNYADRRTAGYFKLQEWISRGWLKILNDPVLHEQLLSIRYRYGANGKKRLFTKDEMRKDGIASPDRSDALMMAVYFADQTMGPGFGQPKYAIHGNPALEREVAGLPHHAQMS